MPIGTDTGDSYENEVDYLLDQKPIISGGLPFTGKTTDAVPDVSKIQPATQVPPDKTNAPAGFLRSPRGNLGDILGMDVHDIPEDMGAREFLEHLKKQDDTKYKRMDWGTEAVFTDVPRNDNDPHDFTDDFNTPLGPERQKSFNEKYGTGGFYDYDMQGFHKDNPDAEVKEGQHYPDTYKKPNHPTFSNESMYHGLIEEYNDKGEATKRYEGGQWEKLDDGTYAFTPGRSNLEHHTTQELIDYFKKYEKKNILILPGASNEFSTKSASMTDEDPDVLIANAKYAMKLQDEKNPYKGVGKGRSAGGSSESVAEPSAERLVVAGKNPDGTIRYGKPGELHVDLAKHDKDWKWEAGFAKPGGEFMDRSQAFRYLKEQGAKPVKEKQFEFLQNTNPGNLESVNYERNFIGDDISWRTNKRRF